MKSLDRSFNIFFAIVCLVLAAGCSTSSSKPNPKKLQSTIRLYLEGQKADKTTAGTVLTVERDPFLDESDVSKVAIVEDPDGTFYIQLGLNDHGTLLLDMYTASNKGKHIIVFSQFPTPGKKAEKPKKDNKKSDEADDSDLVEKPMGQPKPEKADKPRESAWLAAVLVRSRISNGLFRFTPDVSRTECNRIVRGLRNVIAKNKDNKENK